jgi:hypothetical protein
MKERCNPFSLALNAPASAAKMTTSNLREGKEE